MNMEPQYANRPIIATIHMTEAQAAQIEALDAEWDGLSVEECLWCYNAILGAEITTTLLFAAERRGLVRVEISDGGEGQ